MTFHYRIIFLLLLSASTLFSQSINGFVREESSGEPISYANVFLSNTAFGAATSRDGYFVITDVPNKCVRNCSGQKLFLASRVFLPKWQMASIITYQTR